MFRLWRLLRPIGIEGCDSTGASRAGSVAMASANPPVKHIPMAPTPGPPQRSCSSRARARSQSMHGEVLPVDHVANSRLTQAGPIELSM